MRTYQRGSWWRKWDLQVHTPCSLVEQYRGSSEEEKWEGFITDLEALPEEYAVLGINDYLFLDGFKKVLEYKRADRLKNIHCVLPVVELRLDKFVGSGGRFGRMNFHVVFSDDLNVETIQAQFLPALQTGYKLSPEVEGKGLRWNGVIDRQSLEDLGKMIIDSVPEKEKSKFGSPLIEGFNALNVSLENVNEVLSSHYFVDKVITAVGKTEWSECRWNDHSIAEKKTIINEANIILTSAPDPEAFKRSRDKLREEAVNDRLFDCSDAHYNSDSREKDRIGKCFTWVKADPTFKGLLMAIKEYEERVFAGDEPPVLRNIRERSTKYIKSVEIGKVEDSQLDEDWFDCSLELNPGLVAIIGNKGSGKSALADTLGLLGNSRNEDDFSFLHPKQFRNPKDKKAKEFKAKLTWESDSQSEILLSEKVDPNSLQSVRYIPQNYLEKLCTQLGRLEDCDFYKEIQNVIFSHIRKSDRLGQGSLQELISFRTEEVEASIEQLRDELSTINAQIVDLKSKLEPEYKLKLENKLKGKKEELEALEGKKPKEVKKPDRDPGTQREIDRINGDIIAKQKELDELKTELEKVSSQHMVVVKRMAVAEKLLGKIRNLKKRIDSFEVDSSEEFEQLGIKVQQVFTYSIKTKPLDDVKDEAKKKAEELEQQIDPENRDSLVVSIEAKQEELNNLRQQLNESNRLYQSYLKDLKEWEAQKQEIGGDETKVGTLKFFEAKLREIDTTPELLKTAVDQRKTNVGEIYRAIAGLSTMLAELYEPVQAFADKYSGRTGEQMLEFGIAIVPRAFQEGLFDLVTRKRAGSFCGIEPGTKRLDDILAKADFSTEEDVMAFLEKIMTNLRKDMRDDQQPEMNLREQLKENKTVKELYDYLFSLQYLEPRYSLRWSGRELDKLSPGEKGTVLLVFYLLIDNSLCPLIMDQPEENLDNETVFKVLVPLTKEAKKLRQVIIVTHNPNLAVVCDAEQTIHAKIDKEHGNKVTYTLGSIENPEINRKIIDVLEGTQLAFDNRDDKYEIAGSH